VATYKTEGIIIKRINFGEADRILTIFSKHYGKIYALAKGVRRVASKKGGNVELFNWVTLFLVTGKNLDIVTEAQVREPFSQFRQDLKKIGLAYYLCELVDQLTAEKQKNQEVFQLLVRSLKDLENDFVNSKYRSDLIQDFRLKILTALGFWPKGKRAKDFDTEAFIEEITERRLKSQSFLKKLTKGDKI
jgi:DNA repair protein RecO (recombination protein O)